MRRHVLQTQSKNQLTVEFLRVVVVRLQTEEDGQVVRAQRLAHVWGEPEFLQTERSFALLDFS